MISACVCTFNPRPEVFRRCQEALRAQAIPGDGAELVVVDNASTIPLNADALGLGGFPFPVRVVRESKSGLSFARVRAVAEARGEVVVFVDDDNFLAPTCLAAADRLFREQPRAGAGGGSCLPVFEAQRPEWFADVADALAIRRLAPGRSLQNAGQPYPAGAGLVVRKRAFEEATALPLLLTDRQGRQLSSGGDTELCLRIARLGWEIWYDSALVLEHCLAAERFEASYLERLEEGFGQASVRLELYDGFQPPWPWLWYPRRAFYHWRQHRQELRPGRCCTR